MRLSSLAIVLVHVLCVTAAAITAPPGHAGSFSARIVSNVKQVVMNIMPGSKPGSIQKMAALIANIELDIQTDKYKLYFLRSRFKSVYLLAKVVQVKTEEEEQIVLNEMRILKDVGQYRGRGVEKSSDRKCKYCKTYYILMKEMGVPYPDMFTGDGDAKKLRDRLEKSLTLNKKPSTKEAIEEGFKKMMTNAANAARINYWVSYKVEMNPDEEADLRNYQFKIYLDERWGVTAEIINFSGGKPPKKGILTHRGFPKEYWTQQA